MHRASLQGVWASSPTRNSQVQTTHVVAPPTVAMNANPQVTAAPENPAQPIANLAPQGDAWQLMLSVVLISESRLTN